MDLPHDLAVKALLLEKACDLDRQLGEKRLVIWTSQRQTGQVIAPCANPAALNIRDSYGNDSQLLIHRPNFRIAPRQNAILSIAFLQAILHKHCIGKGLTKGPSLQSSITQGAETRHILWSATRFRSHVPDGAATNLAKAYTLAKPCAPPKPCDYLKEVDNSASSF
jgi:hypothetical protein